MYSLFKEIAKKKVKPVPYKVFKKNALKTKEFKSIKFTDPMLPVEARTDIFCYVS